MFAEYLEANLPPSPFLSLGALTPGHHERSDAGYFREEPGEIRLPGSARAQPNGRAT